MITWIQKPTCIDHRTFLLQWMTDLLSVDNLHLMISVMLWLAQDQSATILAHQCVYTIRCSSTLVDRKTGTGAREPRIDFLLMEFADQEKNRSQTQLLVLWLVLCSMARYSIMPTQSDQFLKLLLYKQLNLLLFHRIDLLKNTLRLHSSLWEAGIAKTTKEKLPGSRLEMDGTKP